MSGMRLAMAVLHPKRGNVLLNAGFQLRESQIRKLSDLGVHELWIEYPGTDEIKRFISPAVMQSRSMLVSLMADQFDQVGRNAHARLNYAEYRNALTELIEELALDTTCAMHIAEIGGRNNSDLRHSSEVCHLSILLGLKLQSYVVSQRQRLMPKEARNLVSLGLGAMLHDVGYLKLDPDVRRRYLESRDENDPEWQAHVHHGYQMVQGDVRPSAAGVILQHHQHYDGSGFPREIDENGERRGRRGDEIHVFARIACVANYFDRLSRGPEETNQPRVRVLREMLWGPLAQRFDPTVLRALVRAVPAYPPGAIVTLSNGERAVVVDWDARTPCRPVVQVMPDGDVTATPTEAVGERYDLQSAVDLAVVEQDGVDVREDNFAMPPGASEQPEQAAA